MIQDLIKKYEEKLKLVSESIDRMKSVGNDVAGALFTKGHCLGRKHEIQCALKDLRELEEQDEFSKAYDQYATHEIKFNSYNDGLLTALGVAPDFTEAVEDLRITDKIEIVDEPQGKPQIEQHGKLTVTHVDQWNVGIEGDSFAGFIYAKFSNEDRWLKIPYEC